MTDSMVASYERMVEIGSPALTIVVYSLNMFGGAMWDLLDPRLRGGEG